MTSTLFHIFNGFLFILLVVVVTSATARPHFGDGSQATSDQDTSNLIDSTGLTNEQLEQIVQRLEEYTNRLPVGWERLIRGPEMKRQSRFRQCYFNPVSCFKK